MGVFLFYQLLINWLYTHPYPMCRHSVDVFPSGTVFSGCMDVEQRFSVKRDPLLITWGTFTPLLPGAGQLLLASSR